MKTLNYNITDSTSTKVLNGAVDVISIDPTMTICNLNNSETSISVYYYKENYDTSGTTTEIYYILKAFIMPAYKTLTLDKTDMTFSNKGFDLYIELVDDERDVDVIINI